MFQGSRPLKCKKLHYESCKSVDFLCGVGAEQNFSWLGPGPWGKISSFKKHLSTDDLNNFLQWIPCYNIILMIVFCIMFGFEVYSKQKSRNPLGTMKIVYLYRSWPWKSRSNTILHGTSGVVREGQRGRNAPGGTCPKSGIFSKTTNYFKFTIHKVTLTLTSDQRLKHSKWISSSMNIVSNWMAQHHNRQVK